MDPTLLIVVTLALLVGGVLFAVLWNERRKDEARRAGAEARGWTYRGREGIVRFTIEGVTDDVPWKVSVTRGRGEHSVTHTRFETPAPPVDGIVLIGPRIPAALASFGLGGGLVQMFLQKLLGPQAAELAHVKDVEVGSAELRAVHTVLATDAVLAADVLTPEVEALLLGVRSAWREGPIVLRWRHEIVVRLQHGTWAIDDVDALVRLGVALRGAAAG